MPKKLLGPYLLYATHTKHCSVNLRTFPALESWTSTPSRRRAEKELWDLFRVCKKNIYPRLLPFKHLLNSTSYRKTYIPEGNAKAGSQGQLALSWAALKVSLKE